MTTTAELTPFVITEPGLYRLTHEEYHADPVPGGSLSSTGIRKLTPPDGSPARFKYDMGRPIHKREFDLGQLAHNQLTGHGPEIVVLDAENFRKQDTRDQRDDAYAAGKVPILPEDWDVVHDMMQALQDHPWAGALFERGSGMPEPSMFWQADSVWYRSRPDMLSYRRHPKTGQLMVADYKTARSSEKFSFTRHAYQLGYHQQAALVCDAVKTVGRQVGLLTPDDLDPMFVFVVQEKTRPYIPNVIEIASDALMWGRALNQEAVELYKRCRRAGRWPGYSDDIETMPETPVYLQKAYEDFLDD